MGSKMLAKENFMLKYANQTFNKNSLEWPRGSEHLYPIVTESFNQAR